MKKTIIDTLLFFFGFYAIWIGVWWFTIRFLSPYLFPEFSDALRLSEVRSSAVTFVCVSALLLTSLYPIFMFKRSTELDSRTKWINLFISYGVLLVLGSIILGILFAYALGSGIVGT